MFGLFVPVFVVVCSVILIVRLRFFLFTSFPRIFLFAYRSLGRVDARRSLFLALAGTLGVGNIVGVAVGIIVGGKGSVFWLILSSLFSMILKYSEASLTAQNSGDSRYGMISLIKNSYPVFGNFASCIYAFLCMLLSFFMGAMLQSSSVCMSVFEITGVSRYFIGIVLCILVFVAISFKKFGIIRVVSWLVPIASILYLALCLFSIFKGIHRLPKVIADIMRSAFSVSSIGGGLCGFALSSGIKEGFSRGLLSNEAGAGTSTLAHATNSACTPAEVGVLGMAEVIVDTVVFCPMTALAVLVNVSDISSYPSGISLIMDSLGGAFYGSGIVLCHENEKDIYGDVAERCLELLNALPSLSAVFDPANFIQCGVDIEKAWALLKDKVYYLHIKDATESGIVVPSGKGVGKLEFVVKDFLASGERTVSIEPHLADFVGFSALEQDEKSALGFTYKNNFEAFSAAVSAFKAIADN